MPASDGKQGIRSSAGWGIPSLNSRLSRCLHLRWQLVVFPRRGRFDYQLELEKANTYSRAEKVRAMGIHSCILNEQIFLLIRTESRGNEVVRVGALGK